jgi:hypothetical protein
MLFGIWRTPQATKLSTIGGSLHELPFLELTIGSVRLQNEGVEIALDDHVLDRCHGLLEQICVGRVCVVHIYLFLRLSYQVAELVGKEVHTGLDIVGLSCVVWKDLADWAHATGNLFSEEINLVEEQDESRLLKVFGVGDGLEQHEGFVHLITIAVFDEYVVVAADGNEEQHDLDIVEDVYPLLPLRPLTTNIDHLVRQVAQLEDSFRDARRP